MNAQSDASLTTRAKIAGAFALGFGFFAMVGVTGLSLVIGLVGLWALVWGLTSAKRPLLAEFSQGIAKNWLAWLSFGAFVVWVMASATWSPAPELAAQSVRRLACMGILAPLAVWASASTSEADQVTLRRAIIAALGMALVFLSFETLSGAAANKLASPEKDPLAIAGDLGRAATATLCLTWIGFACIKRSNFGPRLLFGLVIFSGFVALQFGTDLNAVGLVLGTCAALLALTFPRVAIGILSGVSALIVISAPQLYPFLTKIAVTIAPGGHLPMSYGRRAQMWNLAADLIAQKPLTGWGLGAGSTFDKVVRFEGFDWPQIQLHPHSAPLHIWLETGAIGAILASIAIVAAGGAAISTFGRHKVAASVLVGGLTFLALQWGMSHAAWREWMWTCFAMIIAGALALRDFAPKRSLFEDDPV